ncbi:MAG: histidine kinase [Chitinophagaceae bacterium]|nr:histidine kinase [Chitinophagaceae bacterium]
MWLGKPRYWIFQALGWGSFFLLYTFFAFSFSTLELVFFKRLGTFIFFGILFSHLMRLLVVRFGLLQRNLTKQIFLFFGITIIASLIASFAYVEVMIAGDILKKVDNELLREKNYSFWFALWLVVLNNAFLYFLLFFIWHLIYFVYHYVEKSRKQQLDTLHLESLVKELELQTIKAHINPHFIFNSLNSIRALVDENPQRARKAVTELSNILRSSLQSEKMETVTLEKELSIVKDYLALENMRFEDRLKIEYDIDEDTLDQPVPPMMLQTLVENAIKHGIGKQIDGGIVKVISDFKGGYHELSVQNTGVLNGYKKYGGEGFGLSSTTNRLSLLYGDKARFEIKQINPLLVEAKVLIPVVTI